jgi:methionyl-tRNA formyltransferase
MHRFYGTPEFTLARLSAFVEKDYQVIGLNTVAGKPTIR